MNRAFSVAVVLPVVVACAQPEPEGLTAADSAALRSLDSSFVSAILGRDWQALESYYAEDAVLMPPNGPTVVGATAITQWFANTGLAVTEFTTSIESLEGRAGSASIRSTYTLVFTIPPAAATVTDSGKALWLVHAGLDGRWQIATDIWNTSVPLSSP